MTFSDYLGEVAEKQVRMPSWRLGQTYFNCLEDCKPILASLVRGTVFDPFYSDARIGEFLRWACRWWDEVIPENVAQSLIQGG